MVFASCNASLKRSVVAGPLSPAVHPAGVCPPPADEDLVHFPEDVVDRLDLPGDLGPPEDRRQRPGGGDEGLLEISDLVLHEKPCALLADEPGDGAVRRVGPAGGPRGIRGRRGPPSRGARRGASPRGRGSSRGPPSPWGAPGGTRGSSLPPFPWTGGSAGEPP